MSIKTIAFILIFFIAIVIYYWLSQPRVHYNLDHIESLWNQKHDVMIEHSSDINKNVHITTKGAYVGGEKLFAWDEVRTVGGGRDHALLTIHKKLPEGSKKQVITIQSSNLSLSADELVEVIRLAYNYWIDSLSKEDREKVISQLDDEGY